MDRAREDGEYSFTISTDRLKLFAKLTPATPAERLRWLEEAHEFVSKVISYEQLKQWKLYLNRRRNSPKLE